MNTNRLLSFALLLTLVPSLTFAQGRGRVNYQSVKVEEGGNVTFSIYAPNASSVKLGGDLTAGEFTKDENGVWSGTATGVEPGSYRYTFNVDGLTVVDPRYPMSRDIMPLTEVYPDGMFWQIKDVPHGLMSSVYYHSTTMNAERRMHVWTPAGYVMSTEKLPVFYLVHGGGDNDSGWPQIGCAGAILDNLYAEGKIAPMIVVMPDGSLPTEKFADELFNDIMPFIEANFRVKTGRDNTALAGLSQGGIEVLDTFMSHPDAFRYINVMSSGWHKDREAEFEASANKLPAVAKTLNDNVKLLRFTQGGPADIAYKNGHLTMEVFDKCGVKYEYSEMPGGHNWYVWRYDLHYFAQKLFK